MFGQRRGANGLGVEVEPGMLLLKGSSLGEIGDRQFFGHSNHWHFAPNMSAIQESAAIT